MIRNSDVLWDFMKKKKNGKYIWGIYEKRQPLKIYSRFRGFFFSWISLQKLWNRPEWVKSPKLFVYSRIFWVFWKF